MPQELPEMIELLITKGKTPSGRSFVTVMNQFIQRMPMIHSTDKAEFFIGYFLGGIYNFQHTKLKEDLQVTASFWKFDHNEKTLDFVFEIGNRENNNKHLVFRSITVLNDDGSPYAAKTKSKQPYASLAFKDVMLAKIAYKNTDHKEGLNFKEEFYQTRFKEQRNTDSAVEYENKLRNFGFEKIEFNSGIEDIDEETVKKFSLDEEQVKNALGFYLKGNVDLFKKFKPIFQAQLKKALESYLEKNPNLSKNTKNIYIKEVNKIVSTEAFSHGFLYGSLSLNFKNRYHIDCYVERISGNGYTDIMMTSRANNRRSNSIAIIIELKAGIATAREAIDQIQNKGYFQHVLSLRTYSETVIIAGVNFNLADDNRAGRAQLTTRGDVIFVSTAQIPTKKDVIGQILKTSIDPLLSDRDKQEKIQKNLIELYYSRFGELNFRSFLSLLMGYVITYSPKLSKNNNFNDPQILEKSILLLPEHPDRFAMLTIDFKSNHVKKTIVLELSSETGARTRHQPESPIPAALNELCSKRKDQQDEIHKISIRIDATKNGPDFFSLIRLQRIDLRSFDAVTTITPLKGTFHPLQTLTFSDFFTKKHLKEFVFSPTLKDSVQKVLFPLRSLFQGELEGQKKEFVFQAVMQGMIAGLNQETCQVRTFIEPNYSAQGRADLVATLPSFNAQKELLTESLFIFEFKVLVSSSMISRSVNAALEQAEKYVDNLKSLSDARKVALMGLVMNSQAKKELDFLTERSSQHAVDHISTDERLSSPERSPNKRKRVNQMEQSSEEEGTPKRKRCQRSVGASCRIDFTLQLDEEVSFMTDLAQARERGHIILLADSYALLLALIKVNHPIGKIFLLDENIENLNRIFQLLVLAQSAETLETYLQTVQLKFPKAASILKQGIDQLSSKIDFKQLKGMLADNQLSLIKMNEFFSVSHGKAISELHQPLGIGNEKIAAIYLGDYEYRHMDWEDSAHALLKGNSLKDQILFLLSPEDRIDLYRKTLPNNDQISLYSGSKAYLEQEWQPVKRSLFSFDSHEENLLLLKSAQDWCFAIKQHSNFNKDWIPILETARQRRLGKEQIHFLDTNTHKLRTVELDGIFSTILRENLNLLYASMADATALKKNIPESLGDSTENIESVDGLNMAFTVQAIFDLVKVKDRAQFQTEQGPLYTALQVHHYLNLVQMAHSTLMDVNKVVDIVKTLLREELTLAEKPLSFFQLSLKQGAGEGLAALFGVANVVLDSVELHAAKTAQERVTFSAQLVFDTGGLSLSLTSLGAAYVGSTTVASVLGAGSVILSGVAIGTMALVQAFQSVAKKAEAVGSYFYQLDDAYRHKGYKKKLFSQTNQFIMHPIYGAVVTEINFISNTLYYGSPYIYAAPHRGEGNGNMNYLFWFGTTPRVIHDKQQAINIRERLDYPKSTRLENWKTVSTWILPSTPIIYLDYGWMILPGATLRQDRGFSVLRKLEKVDDFHYDFYVFPIEFIIDSIHEEAVTTPIKIILNEQERTLIIPNFSDQDKKIYKNLHYTIEAPTRLDRCSIVLNRIGSLTLLSQSPHTTWTLVTEDFSVDRLRFTTTGIEIADSIPIKMISPHNERCLLVDKNLFVFAIDWSRKKLLLQELNFPFFKNDWFALKTYIQDKSFHTRVKLNYFPLQDHKGITYNGTAYYLVKEDRCIYTQSIPERINVDSDLIECVANRCYFVAPPYLFWQSNSQTHQLKENYLLYSESLGQLISNEKNSSHEKTQIESVVVQADGSVTILQLFKNKQGKSIQKASYHLIQNKLILFSIEDDQLSQILINTQDKVLHHYIKSIFNQQPDSLSVWDDYPQLVTRTILAELSNTLRIFPLSEHFNSNPVWLRQRDNGQYQLINPRVEETKLIFLGALLAADGSDVFYFFLPAEDNSSAQLFRQIEGAAVATSLPLSITHAYYEKEMLFILTPENIIKNINVLGETSTVSFNAAWIRAHPYDWWKKITVLLRAENPSRKHPIILQGLTDLSGKALAVWYDLDQKIFVMMQPPLKSDGDPFHVSYLTRIADIDFFFCDNGILYQQTALSDTISTYFQGIRLQLELPPLIVLADSLQAAYFHKQRLWIHQNGAIFSLNPFLPKLWYLEKIELSWFHSEPLHHFFLSNKLCFIQKFKSKFIARYESHFFRSDLLSNPIDFLNKTSSFITSRKNAFISIELQEGKRLWWNPNKNRFFYNPSKGDTSDWRYLGIGSGLFGITGIVFFSPKAKMVYFNPAYQDYSGEYSRSDTQVATELAMSYRDVFLWVLDQWPTSSQSLFPLFLDKKNLNLYISSESSYIFEVPKAILEHYQVTFYQFFSFSNKTLIFPFSGEIKYKKNKQDIILSGSSVTGQWTFLQGMRDETWNRTGFDITDYYKLIRLHFFLEAVRTCLLYRDEESLVIKDPYDYANTVFHTCLSPHGEKNLLLNNDSPLYVHHDWHRLEVEAPNFVDKKRDAWNKISVVFPWLIISFLSATLGGVIGSVYCLFTRRFRQNNAATLPVVAASLPLLALGTSAVSSEERNPLVHCQEDFFKQSQCILNESSIGLLGYCHNGKQALIWFHKHSISTEATELFWYMLGHDSEQALPNYASLNWESTSVTVSSNYLYFDPEASCRQTIDLRKIQPVSMAFLFPYLPDEAKKWLQTQWNHKKVLQDKILQNKVASQLFKQKVRSMGLNYFASECFLHTSAGDFFQLFSLRPNWREQDHRYYLARCLTTGQQLCWDDRDKTNPIMSIAAVVLETALLHPKLQAMYGDVHCKNSRYTKQAIRFLADLLQFGYYNFSYLPSLLEFLFFDSASIHLITLGLRTALIFSSISNDLSYYYLGIALFFLPQFPLLLEHLGIPVTHYVNQALKKLTQFFIVQSLVLSIKPDQDRLIEQERALVEAKRRVEQGQQRLSRVTKPLVGFFNLITRDQADQQDPLIESPKKIQNGKYPINLI
ncbi:hypothetical protein A1D18_02510 [Candidatus Rickettsiella isopodorum]|jgi:hypothetical protein|uniref:TcdA/TcdB toxin pore forming domain-containing protein n=1 Tax=Candidatus Rickettsiella isopodorum TaxID=1225476 RepID=A0A1J8P5B8_9COXI|nr:TcdA/TcdB pore-forming domain-containing protein [Candidatus Rickettsiella isopodorum]OIZ94996.1 hypothetical protein A1D18_02510 [Candidatus Rickettsiella isopodorum]